MEKRMVFTLCVHAELLLLVQRCRGEGFPLHAFHLWTPSLHQYHLLQARSLFCSTPEQNWKCKSGYFGILRPELLTAFLPAGTEMRWFLWFLFMQPE